MSTSICSQSLGLKNPLLTLGWMRLVAAGGLLVLIGVSVAVAMSSGFAGVVQGLVVFRCCLAFGFAVHLAISGLRAVLAYVPQGDVPGPLKDGATAGRELLEKRLIVGTYDPPQSLMGLLIYRLSPRFTLLTPPHRRAAQGIESRLVWLVVSWGAAGVVGWPALWLSVIVLSELASRWLAISQANSEKPSTSGVREVREHLGDKGDPVGLFHDLRHVFERFRWDEYPNRCLSETPPHVAEQIRDARLTAETYLETQPRPIDNAGQDGLILGVAAVWLTLLSWGLLLLTPLAANFGAGALAAIGSGFIGVAAAVRTFRIAYGCYAAMRFESDLYLLRMRGTYNTTRVGSQLQRTSFQSDIYLDVYSARLVSELAPEGKDLLLDWRVDSLLHSPRLIVTVQEQETHAVRVAELLQSARDYQDQASSARPTDLASAEYAQHLARLQAESYLAAQAMTHGQIQAQVNPVALPNPISPIALPNPNPPRGTAGAAPVASLPVRIVPAAVPKGPPNAGGASAKNRPSLPPLPPPKRKQ